jgi:3-hydroxyanthranilate 3,4-dioxygenase
MNEEKDHGEAATPRLQLSELDRRAPASAQAAGRQQKGVRGRRDDRSGRRRAERAHRLSDDPVEEFFYQLKGDMLLKVVDNDDFYDVPIREGEVFLLPAHVRHSPQRPQEGSIGLVVEAARSHELDAFEWYCFECQALVHRIEVKVQHLVKDLPPLYEAFYADEQARKCKSCGTIHPGKKPPPGWVKL